MKKIRVYNNNEINILLNNINVERIKNKSQIVYKNEFKLWAVKMKINNPEMTAREIFSLGGFDMNVLDEQTPQKRLSSWLKRYKMFGEDYFNNTNAYSYKAITKDESINNKNNFAKDNTDNNKSITNDEYYTFFIQKDKNDSIKIVRINGGKHGKADCKI